MSLDYQKEADYTFYMPKPLTYPVQVVVGALLVCIFLYNIKPIGELWSAAIAFIISLLTVLYVLLNRMLVRITNLDRRLEARDRLCKELGFKGSEKVLDVGCGNGILLLGAVKHLTTGSGIGIDIWSEGAGDSKPERFLENAFIEGVSDKVILENEDVCSLPYNEEQFDIIMSGLTMHHMRSGKEYQCAITEMERVLKPSGIIAIYDEPFTILLCAKLMKKCGLSVERRYSDMLFAKKVGT